MGGVIQRIRQQAPWRPGARELLFELKRRGVPNALVTMSWQPIADEVIAQLPTWHVQRRRHRRHGAQRQTAPRALPACGSRARRRSAVVRGDRGLPPASPRPRGRPASRSPCPAASTCRRRHIRIDFAARRHAGVARPLGRDHAATAGPTVDGPDDTTTDHWAARRWRPEFGMILSPRCSLWC